MTENIPLSSPKTVSEAQRRDLALKREQGTVDRIKAGSRALRSFVEILNNARGKEGMALLKAVFEVFKSAVNRIGAAIKSLADRVPGGLESVKDSMMPVGRFLWGGVKKMKKTYDTLSFSKGTRPATARPAVLKANENTAGLNKLLAVHSKKNDGVEKTKSTSLAKKKQTVRSPGSQVNKTVLALLTGRGARGARS